MKKHILWLIVGLLLFALLLWGAKSLDSKISMPLLGNKTIGDGTESGNIDDADAAAVDALIAGIGTPVTADSKAAAEAARAAYDKLSDSAKAKVTKLSELEAAEKTLAELNAADTTDDEQTDHNTESKNISEPGTKVTFLGGKVYVSPTASSAANTINAQSACTVTYYVEDAEHPYHLISQDGRGVYGWVDASSVTEGKEN